MSYSYRGSPTEAYRRGRGRSRVESGASDALGGRVSLECTTSHIGERVYNPNVMCLCQKRGGRSRAAAGTAVSEWLRRGEVATLHTGERVYLTQTVCVSGGSGGRSGAATGPAASERLREVVLVRQE
jgi:hypothetical protein